MCKERDSEAKEEQQRVASFFTRSSLVSDETNRKDVHLSANLRPPRLCALPSGAAESARVEIRRVAAEHAPGSRRDDRDLPRRVLWWTVAHARSQGVQ